MVNLDYNPFNPENLKTPYQSASNSGYSRKPVEGWQEIFHSQRGSGFEERGETVETSMPENREEPSLFPRANQRFFQFKNKYILSAVKSGLMVIDQRRAHERVLFENFLLNLSMGPATAQQELFPRTIEIGSGDWTLLDQIKDDLTLLGVEISFLGQSTISISALPAHLKIPNPEQFLLELIGHFKENMGNQAADAHEKLSMSMAKASAIPYGRQLEPIEMQDLVDKLFACRQPNLSPDGKPIVSILMNDEIEKRFK